MTSGHYSTGVIIRRYTGDPPRPRGTADGYGRVYHATNESDQGLHPDLSGTKNVLLKKNNHIYLSIIA